VGAAAGSGSNHVVTIAVGVETDKVFSANVEYLCTAVLRVE
jgi:hypothetical protein